MLDTDIRSGFFSCQDEAQILRMVKFNRAHRPLISTMTCLLTPTFRLLYPQDASWYFCRHSLLKRRTRTFVILTLRGLLPTSWKHV